MKKPQVVDSRVLEGAPDSAPTRAYREHRRKSKSKGQTRAMDIIAPCEQCGMPHKPLQSLREIPVEDRPGIYRLTMVCPNCDSEHFVNYTSDELKAAQAKMKRLRDSAAAPAGFTRGLAIQIRIQERECKRIYEELNPNVGRPAAPATE